MSTLRSASYAFGVLGFAAICAICFLCGPRLSAVGAPVPRLLFVSDPVANLVEIFSLPALVLRGTLTGFSKPHGLCSDPSGNIWVANTGTRQALEYTRTGTLISTLTDTTGVPVGCDRRQNVIALANYIDLSSPPPSPPPSGPGEPYITVLPSGTPYSPTDAHVEHVEEVGFDAAGNLFFDGRKPDGTFVLGEVPSGSSTITIIHITGGTLHAPGMVQWYADGSYLAVGDRRCDISGTRTTCIYHVSISGSTGTITGKTTFKAYNGHLICDMAQGTIGASGEKYIAGGDDESPCTYATSGVYRWAYPAGGAPTNSNNTALTHPFGTAISAK